LVKVEKVKGIGLRHRVECASLPVDEDVVKGASLIVGKIDDTKVAHTLTFPVPVEGVWNISSTIHNINVKEDVRRKSVFFVTDCLLADAFVVDAHQGLTSVLEERAFLYELIVLERTVTAQVVVRHFRSLEVNEHSSAAVVDTSRRTRRREGRRRR